MKYYFYYTQRESECLVCFGLSFYMLSIYTYNNTPFFRLKVYPMLLNQNQNHQMQMNFLFKYNPAQTFSDLSRKTYPKSFRYQGIFDASLFIRNEEASILFLYMYRDFIFICMKRALYLSGSSIFALRKHQNTC